MKFANMDTNVSPNTGSSSASSAIAIMGPRLRAAAAYARQTLLGLAATQLGVPVSGLTVRDGVVSGGGRSVSYGALLGDKLFNVRMPTQMLATGQAPAKSPSQYRLVGTHVPRVDIPDKVSGRFAYVYNVRVPGMLHARVVRPRGQGAYPSGAPVVSVDESSIRKTGARLVRQGDFLAVVAESEYQAIQASAQLKVQWAEPPRVSSSGNMWKQMREFDAAGKVAASVQFNAGNVEGAFAAAPVKVADSSYMVHYNMHGPIGPCCAVADVRTDGAVIFSNTQNAYATRQMVADTIKLPVNKVRIVYYEGASTFGTGIPNNDLAMAAAFVSQITGRPVRMQFMRWDEHGWGSHSTPLLADLRGGVDANGKLVAYEYTAYMQPATALRELTQQLLGAPVPTPGLGTARLGNTGGQAHSQYVVPNLRIVGKSLPLFDNYLKLGAVRGVNDVQAAFASEQFIDELAHAAKLDPVEFRRRNLSPVDGGRWSSVLEAVAKLANWQPKVAASNRGSGSVVTGRGFALGTISNVITMAAVVADIELDKTSGKITVKDLWAAEQAGLTVSPEGVHNQMIGCLVTGASRALCEEVRFDTKRITSLDWVTYPTIRFKDAPRPHVVTVQRTDLQPTGSGEPSLIPVAAAIANAFFDATGVRIREAPMTPARVRATLKAAGVK
jgi:CO/xanthine dehydrogenase Mo-binding subunit